MNPVGFATARLTITASCERRGRTFAALRPGPVKKGVQARVSGSPTFGPQGVGRPPLRVEDGEALTWPPILAPPRRKPSLAEERATDGLPTITHRGGQRWCPGA
jgi:hypothetical protein